MSLPLTGALRLRLHRARPATEAAGPRGIEGLGLPRETAGYSTFCAGGAKSIGKGMSGGLKGPL